MFIFMIDRFIGLLLLEPDRVPVRIADQNRAAKTKRRIWKFLDTRRDRLRPELTGK